MNSDINAAKPKRLSDSFSALPALVALMQALDGSAGAVLDESLVSEPDYEIPRRLNRILDHVLTLAEGAIDVEDPDRETVLGATKELMFEISSATEYLRSILSELGKSQSAEKKISRPAQAAIDKLAALEFKVPHNKIKHDSFDLEWVTVTGDGRKPLHGFTVNGLVEPKVIGSGHHRFGTAALSEGYSYSLFVRRATEIFYRQCQEVEAAVRKMFAKELQGSPVLSAPNAGPQTTIGRIVDRLSRQPFEGFENEHRQQVPELAFADGSLVVVRTRMLRFTSAGYTVSSHMTARKGHAFRLPYWKKPDH